MAVRILKSMNPLYADAKPEEQLELISECKLALTAYLEAHLGS